MRTDQELREQHEAVTTVHALIAVTRGPNWHVVTEERKKKWVLHTEPPMFLTQPIGFWR